MLTRACPRTHIMNHGIYIGPQPDQYKYLVLPEGSIIARNTPFLPWVRMAPVNSPPHPPPSHLGPGYVGLDHASALYFFGGPVCPDLSSPALLRLDVFEILFIGALWERVLGALVVAGVFNEVILEPSRLISKVKEASANNPHKGQDFSNPFFATLAEVDHSAEPFDWRPDPMSPMEPGATELEYVAAIVLGDLLFPDPDMPFQLVGQLAACLGGMYTFRSRRSPNCNAVMGAEMLASALTIANGGRFMSDARKASCLPGLLQRLSADFPKAFARETVTPKQFAADVELRAQYIFGRPEEKMRIEKECIGGLQRIDNLTGRLLNLLTTTHEAYTAAYSLVSLCLPRRSRELLSALLDDLEAELSRSSLFLEDLLDNRMPRGPFSKVLDELKAHRFRLGAGLEVSSAGSSEDSSSSLGGLRNLTKEQLILAINQPQFNLTFLAIKALGELTSRDKKMEALQEAFTSDSWLVARYMRFREEKLVHRHPLFALLKPILYLDCAYFGSVAAMKPGGVLPHLARHYAWGEQEQIASDKAAVEATAAGKSVRFGSQPRSMKELFLTGQFPLIDYVNAPGGYLELSRILDNADFAETVPYREHFCNTVTLRGMQKFWSALFTASSYSQASERGDTWWTHVEVYISFVSEGENLVGEELEAHKSLAQSCFIEDLRLLRDLHAERLAGVGELADGEQRFDFLLPFETPAKAKLKERSEHIENLAQWRRAAGMAPSKRAYSVVGLSHLSRSHRPPSPFAPSESRSSSVASRSSSRASRDGSVDSSIAFNPRPAPAEPGAKSHLVTWNGARTRFTVGNVNRAHTVVDAKGAAEELGVDINSVCWESLFSTKPGNERFALCPKWGHQGHENERSACHATPAGWDAEKFHRLFTKVVRPSERTRSPSPAPTRESRRDSGKDGAAKTEGRSKRKEKETQSRRGSGRGERNRSQQGKAVPARR